MDALLAWLEHSPLSQFVTQSKYTLGFVSAVHVVGFTLVMGSALVSGLRLTGVLFAERPVAEVVRPASRAIAIGLVLNVITGFLMFSTRPQTAVANEWFRLKMLLLVGAVLMQFVVRPRVVRPGVSDSVATRAVGVLGLALWLGVALAAFAFLLLE